MRLLPLFTVTAVMLADKEQRNQKLHPVVVLLILGAVLAFVGIFGWHFVTSRLA